MNRRAPSETPVDGPHPSSLIVMSINPRMAGSWPGVRFTGPPLNLPAGGFGAGYGTGAHAPDEFFLIDSSDPKVSGMEEAALSFVRFLYQITE